MIMISSKAGQRLAKTKAAADAALEAFHLGKTQGQHIDYLAARMQFVTAAEAVASELIEGRHHEVEGN